MQGPAGRAEDPDLRRADSITLLLLLRYAIEALVYNDAKELQRLSQCIDQLTLSSPCAELTEARSLHALLGAVLKETQRNLRLWRRVTGGRSNEYYGSIRF